MTTLTEPPLIVPAIDVADMPALDQPDERACEFFGRDGRACQERAVWALRFRALCVCTNSDVSLVLSCDDCREQVEHDRQVAQCTTCMQYLLLLHAEPLR